MKYNPQKIDPPPKQSSGQDKKKMVYNPNKIEKKWQKIWDKLGLYQAKDFSQKPKQYILVEFPYPSGDGLHVGHVRSYVALDVIARKKRMEGFNVLYPIGWDAFGLPTENYAIKKGIHPEKITKQNIKVFKKQLKSLGLSFDWTREINTTDPAYYKWTQWIFLQLFKKGLAYQAEIPINWCPSCKIGLANEEVIQGKCERCGAETEKRKIKQWMLKITAYADRLLKDLEKVDYLDKIKTQQINWIGRSEGTIIKFQVIFPRQSASNPRESTNERSEFVEVFTTRVDTIFGVTALVVAPEHEIILNLKSKILNFDEVEKYIEAARKKSDLERTDLAKEKTGVELKGIKAINPINNQEIPIWVGDYVIAVYGGGAVMVVPAHDQRDFDFAQKFNLPIIEVIQPIAGQKGAERGVNNELLEAFEEKGILVNSGEFTGLTSKEAIKKITNWLIKNKLGGWQINYKLRDWVFSRQHYWGEPIPLVFCENCAAKIKNKKQKIKNNEFNQGEILNPGWIAVSEKNLPIKLPYVKKYEPADNGESPLINIKDWLNVKCPKCGGPAKRETDTMPNWAGSSWYFLRYCDPKNNKVLADKKKLKYWMPVDLYNGGMEHTTLHLLYSRFWYKFLYDIGVVPTDEPYACRRSHGMVLAEDNRKMSKSFGNVINPDEMIEKYGADALRVYEMFIGPFDQAIAWSTQGLVGAWRFLNRVYSLINMRIKMRIEANKNANIELERKIHQTIKKVSEDLDNMHFNTAVASLMELLNEMEKNKSSLTKNNLENYLKLLSPFAPHLAEELWHQIHSPGRVSIRRQARRISPVPTNRNKRAFFAGSIFEEKWPIYDSELVKEEEIELVIQINGRVRDKVKTKAKITEDEAKKISLNQDKIKKYLSGKRIKKTIFVSEKLINFIV